MALAHRIALVALLCIVWITILPPGEAIAADIPARPAKIDRDELDQAVTASAYWLISQVRSDGGFVYRVNMDSAVDVKPKYNWLRHAGTIYALAEYFADTPRPEVMNALIATTEHMRRFSLAKVPGMPDALAVWTLDETTGSGDPPTAKLGGAGLGLVAMASLERLRSGSVAVEEMRGLARFIVEMQEPDGSFVSKFTPAVGGKDRSWVSLYYPGEAALGLALLYQLDPNELWIDTATGVLEYLARKRAMRSDVPADHWALIATQRLWPHLNQARRSALKKHARQITLSILSEQVWEDTVANGGFVPDGRTTPTATRLEGLLAAEFLFRDEPAFHRRIVVSTRWGIRFLLDAMIKEGPFVGAMPRATARIPADHPEADSFNRRATEVRIDYVQHALSAFLQYRRFLQESD